jgi:hypothetical protein
LRSRPGAGGKVKTGNVAQVFTNGKNLHGQSYVLIDFEATSLRCAQKFPARESGTQHAEPGETRMAITLTYLPHWRAYVIRRNGRILGMVRCQHPLPFRSPVRFA